MYVQRSAAQTVPLGDYAMSLKAVVDAENEEAQKQHAAHMVQQQQDKKSAAAAAAATTTATVIASIGRKESSAVQALENLRYDKGAGSGPRRILTTDRLQQPENVDDAGMTELYGELNGALGGGSASGNANGRSNSSYLQSNDVDESLLDNLPTQVVGGSGAATQAPRSDEVEVMYIP